MSLHRHKILKVIAVVLLSFNASNAQEDLPELVKRIKPSVVAISTYDAQGEALAIGSGFCIAPGLVVTNHHVIKNASRIDIGLSDRATRTKGRVTVSDETADLAILDTGLPASKLLPLSMATSLPKEGERVFVISNPRGLHGTISDGIVSAIRRFRDAGVLVQMTAAISPGSSGGPVINLQGQVIGVAVGALEDSQSLNFMIPAISVAKLKSSIPENQLLPPIGTGSAMNDSSSNPPPGTLITTFPAPVIRERSIAESRRLFNEGTKIEKAGWNYLDDERIVDVKVT